MICKIHDLLEQKKVSCVELTKKYIEAATRLNGKYNAYVKITEKEALEQAEKVDKKIANGEKIHLLEGVPISLKDNISTKGLETTCCSKMLQGYVPIYDAFVWSLLQKCGAVLIGKTNMDEFAMGSTCETSCFGGAKNSVNVNYVAGGSSGGAASSVGAGLCVFGLGSDTGGSVRQPASFCGIVGLKPTYGAVSRFGLIAFASSLDQIGVLARTAKDTAIVFDNISDHDENDCNCQGRKEDTLNEIDKPIEGLKIGFCKQLIDLADNDVKLNIEQALKVYEKLGAKISEVSLPSVDYALSAYYVIACAEASSNLGRYDGIRYGYRTEKDYHGVNDLICKNRSEGFGDEVKRRILLGTYVLSAGFYDAYYRKAQLVRGKIKEEFDSALKDLDLIVTPTVATTAFECNMKFEDKTTTYYSDCCTVPVNIAGLPAISIPCGFSKEGLPAGLQLIGPRFSESLLLRAAHRFEEETKYSFISKIEEGVNL